MNSRNAILPHKCPDNVLELDERDVHLGIVLTISLYIAQLDINMLPTSTPFSRSCRITDFMLRSKEKYSNA